MENRFFVTVCSDRFSEEILLETQGDILVGDLLKDILKILNWPIEVDGRMIQYILRTEEKELNLTDILATAGVANFEMLWINPDEKASVQSKEMEGNMPGMTLPAHATQQPFWALMPVEQPSLIHPDGFQIILGQPPILIGRQGGEKPVQVDLSEFEKGRLISSRRHAEIILKKSEYCLRAFNTRNGTFIGRDELKPDEVRPLRNNDIIQFGVGGVRLVFRLPS
jgi:hypothetical protein